MSLKRIALFEQTIDPTPALDKCFIYAKDFEGRTEMFFMDQGGAITQITKDGYLNVKYDADVLGLPGQEIDPGYSAGKGALYSKTINGIVELFYIDSNGITTQITNAGQFNVSDKIAEGNTKAEVKDSGTDGYFYVVTEGTEKFRITKDGYVGVGNSSPSSLFTIGKAGTTAGVLSLEGATSGSVSVDVAAVAGTWVMTLPTSGGSNGQYLKTDGSGNCSWSTVSVSPGGSDHQVQYNNDGSFGGADGLYWDHVNSRLGIGTSVPSWNLDIRSDTYPTLQIRSAGNGTSAESYVMLSRAHGTNASPTALQSGERIGILNFMGYGDNYFWCGAFISGTADGNFSDTNSPGYISFYTTPTGANDPVERMRLTSSGILQIGNVSKVTGKINFLGTTSGTVGLTVADAAGTWLMTLPTNDGDSGQFLQTNGSGVCSWASASATPAGSDHQIQYNNNGAFGGAATMYWDHANGRLGLGCSDPAWQVESTADTHNYIVNTAFGTSVDNMFISATGRGTRASPVALSSGDKLGGFAMGGTWRASPYGNFAACYIAAFATEAWGWPTLGAEMRFYTTPNGGGAAGQIQRMSITNDGILQIGLASSKTGQINFVGATSGIVSLKTADAAGTWTMTLPTNDGDSGQFLQTNGSGVCSWASASAVPAGSDHQIQYNNNGAFGGGNLYWDHANDYLGLGIAAPVAPFHMQRDGSNAYMYITAFSNSHTCYYDSYRVRGSVSSPSAVLADDQLVYFGGAGYNGTVGTNAADISIWAAENWNGSAQGSYITFKTKIIGGTTAVERMRITGTGTLQVGFATGVTGQIDFAGTTSGKVSLKVADAAGTWTMTLPTNDGDSGQYLQTNGSGVCSWATVSTLTQRDLTETSSGILTITNGTNAVVGAGNCTIQVKKASAVQDGYLGKIDFATFNAKEPAVSKGNLTETASGILTISGGTGAVIGSGTTIQVKKASAVQDGYLSKNDYGTFNGSDTKWAYIDRCGFVDNTQTSISFNDSNYTFTLTDAGGGWKYFRSGVVNSISGNKTVVLSGTPPAANVYYIFIDDNLGTLSASTSAWTLNDSKIPVSIIAWNNSNTPKYQIQDERHTCLIDRREHKYEHQTRGTQLVYGGTLSGYVVAPTSPVDADNTFGITETQIADEDLFHTLSALVDPGGVSNAYTIFYRTASSTWAWDSYAVPLKYQPSSYIQYDNAGTMTTGQHNKYYNYYLLFTNNSGEARYTLVPGRGEFASASAAYAELPSAFSWTGLPIAEVVIAYQITYYTNSGYSTKGKCRITRDPQRLNIALTTTAVSGGATDHNTLSGLQGGAINEYYHLTETQHTNASRAASGSVDGYLTSTDYNIFNSKAAGTHYHTQIIQGDTQAYVKDTGSDGYFAINTNGSERMRVGDANIQTFTGNFLVNNGYCYASGGFSSGSGYYFSAVGYYYGRTTDGLQIAPLAGSDYGKNNVIITNSDSLGYTHAKPNSINPTFWVQSANGRLQPTENIYIGHNQTDGYAGTEKGNLWLNPYSGVVAIGSVAKRTGKITLSGSTSGTITIQPKDAAGTWSFTLPDNDGDTNQFLKTDGSGVTSWADAINVSDKIIEGNTKAEVRDTGSDGYFYISTEGTERLRVDNTGKLLVGCTSSSWNHEFAIGGAGNYVAFTSAHSTPATGLILRTARGTVAAPTPTQSGDMLGAVYFGGCDTNGNYTNTTLFRSYATQTWESGKNGSDWRVDVTANDTSSNVEALRVTNDRNLLIGTTDNDGTPATGRLVVKGTTNDGSSNCIVLRDSDEANVLTIDTNGKLTAYNDIVHSGGTYSTTLSSDGTYSYISSSGPAWGLRVNGTTWAMYVGASQNIFYKVTTFDAGCGTTVSKPVNSGGEVTFMGAADSSNDPTTWTTLGEREDIITISVGSGSSGVDSTNNLFLANTIILGVSCRVIQAPGGGATNFDVQVKGGTVEGSIKDCLVALNTSAINTGVTTFPFYNAAAAKATLTTDSNVTGSDMKVRVNVSYIQLRAPSAV